MNEIKELNKWRYIPCSWIERLNIIKMSFLPKFIDSIKINHSPNKLFVDIEN